ncbi:MAG: MBL fold metallo-hydrolase [Proteobacteria bacterium]|nr:MBL fold metallo-hydrolase [Pseudomonadota bacterium]
MIINQAGKVTDRIVMLGRTESVVYILKGGDEYALVGGGMVQIVPDMIEQIKEFGIEEEKIKRIFILHAHFDHCGIVPYFKKRWPWARVTASRRAQELLSTPKVAGAIDSMNRMLVDQYNLKDQAESLGLLPFSVEVEDAVGEGDVIPCGDLALEIIDVPGHSSCSMAVYVPREKAMFASDAGGIPHGDSIMTAANSNFDRYRENLEKMAFYDIEIHLAEHYGAMTGQDGRNYLKRSMEYAKGFRQFLEESLKRTGSAEKTTQEALDRLAAESPDGFLSRDVLAMVVGQMVGYLWKQVV